VTSERFMTLSEMADVLHVSMSQARALVSRKDVRAIQVGGRGQWRIEHVELEAYIQRMYAETADAPSQMHAADVTTP
jgi:excisionase family DNA binding protein